MDLKKVKNRQRKALRNGKNNGRGNNRVTSEMMKKRIFSLLENHGREILEAAKDFYKGCGRGCVNVSLTNHPDNPYKTGQLYYVTEQKDKEIQSAMSFRTESDIRISEGITTYEPTVQAVVCVWYDMKNYVTTITDTFAVFDTAAENISLTVH